MALVNADLLSDPFPLSDTLERVPDSSALRVSLNTQFESGIPPARVREAMTVRDDELKLDNGVEQLESALAGVTRTEANLGMLARGLKHLAASAIAARDANTELMHELDELRAHLSRSHEEEQATRFRMSQLEQLLDVIRHESARERQFLIEQQDSFLVEILSDHERQLSELRRSLLETSARRSDSRELSELVAQRDQAREYATRCERQRDAAWHELASGRAPSHVAEPAVSVRRYATPPPLPPESPRNTAGTATPTAIGSISLRAAEAPAPSEPDTERSGERPTTGYSLTGDDLGE